MFDSYIIKVAKVAAGLVIRDRDNLFQFIATDARFQLLHDSRFTTPLAAESAARRLLDAQTGGGPVPFWHSRGRLHRKAA